MTVAFKSNLSFLSNAVALWETNPAKFAKVPGLQYTMLNQHLLSIVIKKTVGFEKNSPRYKEAGNSLMLSLLSITWANKADDRTVLAAAKSPIDQIEKAAKDRGVYRKYKYIPELCESWPGGMWWVLAKKTRGIWKLRVDV